MLHLDTYALIACAAALMLGGLSKGTLGVGLPMVSVPILTTFLPLRFVVAVMYFPVLAANLWQACSGGYFLIALKRFWPLLVTLVIAVWVGTFSLVQLDQATVSAILGAAVACFAVMSLVSPEFRIPPRWEVPLGILAGAVGGFLGGLALIGGPPIIMYFVALHLKKDEFIGCIGLVYLLTLIPAGASFATFGVLRTGDLLPGFASMVPVFAGLLLGQWVRGKIDQARFRKILLGAMIVIGLNLLRKGLF